MKKITFSELHRDYTWKKAVIVIDNKSFAQEYPLESRSYEVNRDTSKFFQTGAISNSIWGTSLDESDVGVRLDLYMYDGGWQVEYCYVLE